MTIEKLIKILEAHSIVFERFTSSAVKTFTLAFSDEFEVLEVINGVLYIDGSCDCNIWDWLGY